MKYMMLLIIVTNLYFGTQREASGVCIQKSVENLEHCSFAGSVVSDQCYALASFDLERNIGKKFLLRETFGEIFYGKDIVSTDHAWFKRKTHLALDFDRFVDPLNLIQHLFTALCTFDGFFSVERFQLDDNGFLMLDEPTNHLDIASKEILEEALNSYTGTVLYVSHDRYFINQTATRILDLTNQSVVNYIGDYDYYLEKKEELTEKYAPSAQEATEETKEETPSEGRLTWQQQKEEQARKRKQENELKKVEKRIEELETRDKEIDDTLVLPDVCTNVGRCAELSREKDKIQAELEELYEKWEELA